MRICKVREGNSKLSLMIQLTKWEIVWCVYDRFWYWAR